MDNFIKELIGLEDDSNIIIKDFRTEGKEKIITVEYKLIEIYCQKCGARMHVKEIYKRRVKHNILQEGHLLVIEYYQRSWVCPKCKQRYTPHVSFVDKHKQISNYVTYYSIVKLADLTRSVASVAADFGISDTQLHTLFLQHVDMHRLPLSEVIMIDEVYTNFSYDCKYSLVIMDFFTQEVIDILPSRREKYTNQYFTSLPVEEKNRVKYVISDMYEPYLNYMNRYFLHAETAVDSFHVIEWILNKIKIYMNALARKYANDKDPNTNKRSDEYYLLKKKRWIMLKNEDNIIDIDMPKKIDPHFHCYMTTQSYREKFFAIDPKLKTIHELKEKYVTFNNKERVNNEGIEEELDQLIELYAASNIDMFVEFAGLLKDKKAEIIHSFVVLPSLGKTVRLSNGAIESFNRKPKDLKRLARGFTNFEFFKQRILFSERANKVFQAIPKPLKEVKTKTGRKRGKYNKKKK